MHEPFSRRRSALAASLSRSRSLAGAGAARPSDPGTGDWPMWGGTPDRNMVSNMKGLPTEWDVKTKKNVKWVADLGSQSYGNPVVAGGMVFVGTNNEALRDPKQAGDRGVLMAFREVDRRVPLAADAREARVGPRQRLAVPGRRLVAAGRGRRASTTSATAAWCWCLDIKGFRDNENDGPVTDEKLTGQNDADVIWSFDMMEEVGSYPHNLANSSPVDLGRPDLRQHLERPGREPRQHPVAAGAGDHRAQQEHRQAGVGGQLGRGPHPARPVVDAVGRHDRRRRSGRVARRATAGCAATRR